MSVFLAALFVGPACAAEADISSTPLVAIVSALVKPNIMLLMDTSESMRWGYMPDELADAGGVKYSMNGVRTVGYKSSQCNVLYYNPRQVYALPRHADGSTFARPSFNAAPYDGYAASYLPAQVNLPVDLGANFNAYDAQTLKLPIAVAHVPQPAYYYVYGAGTQTLNFAQAPCSDTDTGASRTATDGGTWTRKIVGASSGINGGDERQNFANWYAFYRTRISLTKSAASLAFIPLTDSFRVGFITVKPADSLSAPVVRPAKYLPIADFDATQRAAWFAKLFAQVPEGTSPAREGLARVGRHYAGQHDGINTGMTGDPIQYSCQQNFTILTTDGYWNDQQESIGGGAVQIDGTTKVGRQDNVLSNAAGDTPPPIWDGSGTSVQTDKDASVTFGDFACTAGVLYATVTQKYQNSYTLHKKTDKTTKTAHQVFASNVQNLQTTGQYTRDTVQYSKVTDQYFAAAAWMRQTPDQAYAVTTQRSQVSTGYRLSTQTISSETRLYTDTTEQTKRTAVQWGSATYQLILHTSYRNQTQTRLMEGRTQLQEDSYQWSFLPDTGEGAEIVDTDCTSRTGGSCYRVPLVPVWTPVATCTQGAVPNDSTHHFVNCRTFVVAAPTQVNSCTLGQGAIVSDAANHIITTCAPVDVTPPQQVASCTQATLNGVTTACPEVVTFNGPVQTCPNTGTVGVVTTTCTQQPASAPLVPSPPCGTTRYDTTDKSWHRCQKMVDETSVPVARGACTVSDGSAYPYNTVSCVTTNPTVPRASTCTPGEETLLADFVYQTCGMTTTSAMAPTSAPTCTTGFASSTPYAYTFCQNTPLVTVGVASCASPGTTTIDGDGLRSTCSNTPVVTYLAEGVVCTAGTFDYQTVTCPQPSVIGPTAVPSCREGSTPDTKIYTTCSVTHGQEIQVPACSPPQGTVTYTCVSGSSPEAPVASCDDTGGGIHVVGNQTINCRKVHTSVYQSAADAASCQDSAGPNYLVTTCVTDLHRAVNLTTTCSPGTTHDSDFLYTTCTAYPQTTDVPVDTCTGSAVNDVVTSCAVAHPDFGGEVLVPTNSCVEGTSQDGRYVHTVCRHSDVDTVMASAAACAAVPTAPDAYTTVSCNTERTDVVDFSCPGVAVAGVNTVCERQNESGWLPVTTCNPGSTGTECKEDPVSGPTLDANCTDHFEGTAHVGCSTGSATGTERKYSTRITTTVTNYSGSIVVGTPDVSHVDAGPFATDNTCYAPGTAPALPSPNPTRPAAGAAPLPSGACTRWPCSSTVATTGGSENSLADVSQYYYVTDLRPGMVDNVFPVDTGPEDDRSRKQHMTTFTIALGVSGTLNYLPTYRSLSTVTGDFNDIRHGSKAWPIWPIADPAQPHFYDVKDNWNDPRGIDDFWHTAVNGRGLYFSAGNPSSVVSGLSGALAGISARLSTGNSGGSSNLQPVAGDNFAFLGVYKTSEWSGDLQAFTYGLNTGTIEENTQLWSAQTQLDQLQTSSAFCDNRKIQLIRTAAGVSTLVDFTWNTKGCDANGVPTNPAATALNSAEQANFGVAQVANLSQSPLLSDGSDQSIDQLTQARGANLVNFLRGQRGREGFESGVADKLYRTRAHVLGDIVGSQPVYVKAPFQTYNDPGYSGFKAVSRTAMVYVGANDGMLHAFYAGVEPGATNGGMEAWAIIPSAMLPNLYKLADANYKNVHQFFVDGSPVVADVRGRTSNSWRSMLVGGFNAGGKGYYAIDVTVPESPVAMWEFKPDTACYQQPDVANVDCAVGLSFGKPVVTKIPDTSYSADGRWVVLVSSGYNNVPGDGKGYLYVLDANTGRILNRIATGEGSSTTPSNLGQLNAYVDDAALNNTALRAYGGDMLGNIWRFDLTATDAVLLGQAQDANGTPQPITTRPELAELNGKPMVFVGTGRLLGTTDMADRQGQSIYAIVDPLTTANPAYTDLRAALKPMVLSRTTAGAEARTSACSTASSDQARCASKKGWVMDLPDAGERVNINMELVLSTLVVGSNVPTGDVCDAGGYSWLNYLDFASGESNGSFGPGVGVVTHASEFASGSLLVGLNVIRLPDHTFKTQLRVSGGTGTGPGRSNVTKDGFFPSPQVKGKRVSWREIIQ